MLGVLIWGGFTRIAPSSFETLGDHAIYLALAAAGFALHYGLLYLAFRRERATQKVVMNFRAILRRS